MPVVGTPTTPVIITTDQIRMFLRDYADKNILLDEVQFTTKEVNLAISMAVSAFNTITPMSSFTPQSFPANLQYLLLIGTARFLMMSESFAQARNSAVYQDGDLSTLGLSEKLTQYAQLAQQLKAEWDELSRGVKTQANMESCYASLGSGYANVSRFNHS